MIASTKIVILSLISIDFHLSTALTHTYKHRKPGHVIGKLN